MTLGESSPNGGFKSSFQIISNVEELAFVYERQKDGSFITTASDHELDRAEDAELITVIKRNIPYRHEVFKGCPEAVLNGQFKIIQPNTDGTQLVDIEIGTFKCLRCDGATYVEQTAGKYIEPYECPHCERKGYFKPMFPVELLRPIWKLPFSALECSPVGVYSDIYNYIKEYLILKSEEYHLMTLWIMASYLVDDFNTVPYLLFIAPKESGKSQAMRILHQLAYRAFLAASVTPSALFRAIEMWKITLLIDEAEYQIKNDSESGEALYQTLNMGYKRGSYAIRVEGNDRIPTRFDVFGFKAIASTKIFLPTLESRSIIINMSQGVPEKIIIDEQRADIIRSELLHFKFAKVGKLPIKQPVSTSGRLTEILTPLYTVAQILEGLGGVKTIITYEEIIKILDTKLRELETRRSDEEHESVEAMVIEAIQKIKCDNTRDEPNHIKLKEIVQELGWTNDQDPQTTKEASAKVGRILKAMGINTHRKKNGVCIDLHNFDVSKRIDEMIARYLKNENKV